MSDHTIVISQVMGRSFMYSSSVYSCHLFLISSASVKSIPFLSFIEPIFAWNVPLVSLIFLMRSLKSFPFYCFPLFLCIDHWGRLSYSFLLFLWIHGVRGPSLDVTQISTTYADNSLFVFPNAVQIQTPSKNLQDQDNHDGVITHLEPDILEYEVKWPLESMHEQN